MAKTHFAEVDRAGENTVSDDWGDPACGTEAQDPEVNNNWAFVDCKKCLSMQTQIEKEMEERWNHL